MSNPLHSQKSRGAVRGLPALASSILVAVLIHLLSISAFNHPASQTGASRFFEASSPRTVASTDELYKPALLKGGRLIAVALPMIDGVQRALAMYSNDNGETWTQSSELFRLPSEPGTFGYYDFLVDRAGEMHFFFLLDPSTGSNRSPDAAPEAELDIWHLKSINGRTAWEAPKKIWTGRGGDLLSVIQLDSGRILLPISYRTDRNWGHRGGGFDAYTYSGQFDSSALYSDDDGNSWRQSGSVLRTPTPDIETIEGAVEPVVLQLKDRRVWMLIRTQMGRFYESYSSDEGETWSAAVPTSLISSDSPAGLVRLPDGAIVMLLNRNLRFPYAYGGRHVLHAAISNDEGRSWHGYREVMRDPLRGDPPPPGGDFGPSYPYPTVTRDGKILLATACATGTSSGQPRNPPGLVPAQKRDLTLLDPQWLKETSQRTDFSAGINDWSVFGVKGVELVAHPSRSGARVLSIRKTEATWPSAAVWNFPMGARGHLHLNLMLRRGFRGALIGFTDHYSVPYDREDNFYNVYNLDIAADGKLPNGRKIEPDVWHRLQVEWDTVVGRATVSLDGHPIEVLRAKREAEGICYLRLRSTASDTDTAGLLVESADASVSGTEKP